MDARRLSDDEFSATFAEPMTDVTAGVDIGSYVAQVPAADLEGHAVSDRRIERVYHAGDGHFAHVLVATRTPNVFLTVVVDLQAKTVYGHRLLDLSREYGLE